MKVFTQSLSPHRGLSEIQQPNQVVYIEIYFTQGISSEMIKKALVKRQIKCQTDSH